MKASYLTKEERYGKAIRTFYTQDQESGKPLFALAAYSGTSVSQITRRITGMTHDILGQKFLMVADKEWYCGQLIRDLHKQYGVSILVPVKQSENRIREFTAVPLNRYDKTVWGNIATLYTTMKDFDGPLLMLIKQREDGKYFALITPEHKLTPDIAMPTYTKRWRIENFFSDNSHLGVDRLPSIGLDVIQTVLSLRLFAYHVMDNFRHDLGPGYSHKTPEIICREFVDGVQGRLQLHRDVITINIYGFEHEAAAATILTNLDAKFAKANVDPRIPWLGNRRLKFRFH